MNIKTVTLIIAILALSFVLTVGLVSIAAYSFCNAKTAEIGFAHRWAFWTGCQIEVTEGQWIPLESYRYTVPGD